MQRLQLLSQATAVGAGAAITPPVPENGAFLRAYQAGMTGGTSATVQIEVSNDNKNWVIAAILTLTAGSAEGFSSVVPWGFVRANITAISGGGTVDASLTIGTQGVR